MCQAETSRRKGEGSLARCLTSRLSCRWWWSRRVAVDEMDVEEKHIGSTRGLG